jgi:hypothetical protein
LGWSAALLFLVVLATSYFGCAWMENRRLLRRMPRGIAPIALTAVGAVALCVVYRTMRMAASLYGSMRRMASTHLPLLVVYGWLLGILSVGSFFGTTGLNTIILIHVTVWIVFTHYQLSKRSGAAATGLWSWLRTTPTGFLMLHTGVAVAFLGLMALSVYVWNGRCWLGALLAGKNFCYWGLMHISMAFWSAR